MENIFGKRLKAKIKEQKITHGDLAREIFINYATLSMYISGKRLPKADVLADIAKKLDTSVDYLLGLSDHDKPVVMCKDCARKGICNTEYSFRAKGNYNGFCAAGEVG